MGIYDREYYRREGPSFLGSFAERGKVCKWLIGINIVVFFIQILTQQREFVDELFPRAVVTAGWFTESLWLDVDKVLHGQVWRLLTYAFLHDPHGIMHIVFNMLFLWWFGSDVEDIYGPREFLAFYLMAAFLGGVAFVVTQTTGAEAMWRAHAPCLGASGAVTAVLVLCALHYPSRIILLSFFIPVPIWLFVLIQVGQDLYGFVTGNAGHTAVAVHLGGAAFAFVYYKRHWRVVNLWDGVREWVKQRSRPRLRVYREEPPRSVPVTTPPAADADEHLEAKLDLVLEKVARYGQSSLTESERQILLRASEIYKRRRS
jgi:membrane associated rhomboid family serine protease